MYQNAGGGTDRGGGTLETHSKGHGMQHILTWGVGCIAYLGRILSTTHKGLC